MPAEEIEIVLSDVDPYLSGAQFFAALAYPDQADKNRRELFAHAIVRETLEERMRIQPDWAQQLQLIRPAYFSGPEKQQDNILKHGTHRLNRHLVAIEHIVVPHLRSLDTKRHHLLKGYEPTVANMSLLALTKLGWKSGESVSTFKSKAWKPSRPIAHAAAAYIVWDTVLWKKWKGNPQVNRKMAFLLLPEYVETVVEISEHFRGELKKISRFKIPDEELIRFSTRWLSKT
jgi:hypothetical protein